jgi:replicative DNA helicase
MSVDVEITDLLVPAEDLDQVQAVVVSAALQNDRLVLENLDHLLDAMEEPYRSMASIVKVRAQAGQFTDRSILRHELGNNLVRRRQDWSGSVIQPAEMLNLLDTFDPQPGQIEAYIEVLRTQAECKRLHATENMVRETATAHRHSMVAMLSALDEIIHRARRRDSSSDAGSELSELIGYTAQLVSSQRGGEFLGLDSGFPLFNRQCNGLDTGLMILAAPPGVGKTTLLWQIACQVADQEQVPVIFVSMEQDKKELRAKALARLGQVAYHHILRGRLINTDDAMMDRLLGAASRYAQFARHLTIVEGDDRTTVNTIEAIARRRLEESGASRCLLILDYLQILPLHRDDAGRVTSVREKIDLHVSALRRLGRRLNSPVLAICAENRAGYNSTKLDVFKESGTIEYSADVALILKTSRSDQPPPHADYRLLDLNVVKNRNGERGTITFRFYPHRSEFREIGRRELLEQEDS